MSGPQNFAGTEADEMTHRTVTWDIYTSGSLERMSTITTND